MTTRRIITIAALFLLVVVAVIVSGVLNCSPASASPLCTSTPKPPPLPTETNVPPKPFDTPTIPPVFFTPTPIPPGTATVVIPTFTNVPHKINTRTPTPTVVLVYETPAPCSDSCLCLLVTQAVISNDLERTQIAIEQKACQIP